jgi:hypothetical protein
MHLAWIAAMPDMLDLTARCDALHEQVAKVREQAIALREQAATTRVLVAERCADLAHIREQIATRRRATGYSPAEG